MPMTRSSVRLRSLGDDSKPTTPRKRMKLLNNELGRKLEKGTERRSLRMKYLALGRKLDEETLRRSLRMKYKELGWKLDEEMVPLRRMKRMKYEEEGRKRAALSKRMDIMPKKAFRLKPDPKSIYLPPTELAEFALSDYNKKHGTDLEFVRVLEDKHIPSFHGPGFSNHFVERLFCSWNHINFEARRRNNADDPKPFLLFAELHKGDGKYNLTALSLVKPTDEEHGCQHCCSCISHPPHGFRAGFDTELACEPEILSKQDEILSKQDADTLAEFAIEDHNKKHGTNMKFERALGCNFFTCDGLLMDFSKKNASWVHMNFEARVGPKEEVLRLFAELYLCDGKLVLATLSVAEPSDKTSYGNWKERRNIERGCPLCPEHIRHPWRGFSYAFNYPPSKASGIGCSRMA